MGVAVEEWARLFAVISGLVAMVALAGAVAMARHQGAGAGLSRPAVALASLGVAALTIYGGLVLLLLAAALFRHVAL